MKCDNRFVAHTILVELARVPGEELRSPLKNRIRA